MFKGLSREFWIGFGLAVFSIGIGIVIALVPMAEVTRIILVIFGCLWMLAGIWIMAYFGIAKPEASIHASRHGLIVDPHGRPYLPAEIKSQSKQAAAGLLAVTILIALCIGYIAKLSAEIEHLKPRVLTDEQKQALAVAADKVPLNKQFNLIIEAIPDCGECNAYTDDLNAVWKHVPRWQVMCAVGPLLNHRLKGIIIAGNPDGCPEEAIKLIGNALTAAKIEHRVATPDVAAAAGVGPGTCGLFIGAKP